MDTVEQKELHDKIDTLVRNSNGWETIDNCFKRNKDIYPIIKEVERKCLDNGCYGVAIIYVAIIEELLDRLDTD